MSGEGFKVQASIKDRDGDMVNFRADSSAELKAEFEGFPYAEYASAKAMLLGAGAAAPIVQPAGQQAPVQQQAPQQSGGWGGAPQQQQQAPQQQGQGGGSSRFGNKPKHPEGKQCHCGSVLELNKTQSGKTKFQCPAWRWNNGNPNGHDMEWAN